jgi:hypothetical protein
MSRTNRIDITTSASVSLARFAGKPEPEFQPVTGLPALRARADFTLLLCTRMPNAARRRRLKRQGLEDVREVTKGRSATAFCSDYCILQGIIRKGRDVFVQAIRLFQLQIAFFIDAFDVQNSVVRQSLMAFREEQCPPCFHRQTVTLRSTVVFVHSA